HTRCYRDWSSDVCSSDLDLAMPPVALSWAVLQTFPADNAAAGLPVAEKIVNNFIGSVAIQGGAINITFGNKANRAILGKVLSLRSEERRVGKEERPARAR